MNIFQTQPCRPVYRLPVQCLFIGLLVILCHLAGCGSGGGITGTGSQSGNGRISCVVYNDDGSFAAHSTVRLRSSRYTAGTAEKPVTSSYRNTFTDAQGEFTLDSVDTGSYAIEVNNGKSRAVLLTCAVSESDTVVTLPDATLLPTGRIHGSCNAAPGDTTTLYADLFGIERRGVRDRLTGEFIIEDVPAGVYTVRILASSAEYTPVEIPNINITPSGSADIGNVDLALLNKWRFSAKIFINTTASGAAVTGSVAGIPLLVRLRDDNFNFIEAAGDGRDIRFTSAKGIPLPCEIERWDAGKKEADVWVTMDTVHGNDSSQYFLIYWGNAAAEGSADGGAVFDTARGYRGVWHLGDSLQTVNDATVNKFTGNKKDNVKSAAGVCGTAQFFDGSGDYVDFGNACNPDLSSFTVSAWVKRTGKNKIQTIIAKSTGGNASATYGWLLQIDADGALAIYCATGEATWGEAGTFILTSNTWITDTAWHQVAAVINRSDRNDCHVYIDAADVSTYPSAGDIKNIGSLRNTSPLRIGADANGKYLWEGSIDEVTFSSGIRSGDYLRLSYMNQRAADRLLKFGNEDVKNSD